MKIAFVWTEVTLQATLLVTSDYLGITQLGLYGKHFQSNGIFQTTRQLLPDHEELLFTQCFYPASTLQD